MKSLKSNTFEELIWILDWINFKWNAIFLWFFFLLKLLRWTNSHRHRQTVHLPLLWAACFETCNCLMACPKIDKSQVQVKVTGDRSQYRHRHLLFATLKGAVLKINYGFPTDFFRVLMSWLSKNDNPMELLNSFTKKKIGKIL